jgi:hypothetical protein
MQDDNSTQIAIEKEHKDDFKRLQKYLKEEKRIRGKDKVYSNRYRIRPNHDLLQNVICQSMQSFFDKMHEP